MELQPPSERLKLRLIVGAGLRFGVDLARHVKAFAVSESDASVLEARAVDEQPMWVGVQQRLRIGRNHMNNKHQVTRNSALRAIILQAIIRGLQPKCCCPRCLGPHRPSDTPRLLDLRSKRAPLSRWCRPNSRYLQASDSLTTYNYCTEHFCTFFIIFDHLLILTD